MINEHPLEQPVSESLRLLQTPLLNELSRARVEGAYGALLPKEVLYAMKSRLRAHHPHPQVLTLMGGTRAGKTTLLGEMAEDLFRSGYTGAIITFESALIAAKQLEQEFDLKKMDVSHQSGQYTPAEYHYTSQIMERAVKMALEDPAVQFILIETPATTGMEVEDKQGRKISLGRDRGASTTYNIARRLGELEGMKYDDWYITLTAGKERSMEGYFTRYEMLHHPRHEEYILSQHGVTFYGDPTEKLMGGSIQGTMSVDVDESYAIRALADMKYIRLPLAYITTPTGQKIKDPELIAHSKTKGFLPWYFGKYLGGVKKHRVAVAINNTTISAHLYHKRLVEEDYIRKILTQDKRKELILEG